MRASRLAAVIIIAAALVRLALAAIVPLFPDETYYWDWSRHLAAGYFDHPAAIAVLIRAGTIIFGATAIGVRAGVVLAGAIASWALVVLTRDLVSPSAQTGEESNGGIALLRTPEARTALFASVIPVALVGFALATPDAPLLATIAIALVALTRALAAPTRSRESLGWWVAAGIMLGLGFSSKYTAVLLPLGVFVALLTRASLRRRLAEPGPYVATIVAFVVFTPTLLWNAHHEWISFAFQLHHGLGTPKGSPLGRELSLVGGQLGLITPILAVLGVIAVARALRRESDDRRYLLAVIATVVIAFFAISALRKPVEANWPAPALVAAIPLIALQPLSTRRWRGWLTAGLVLAAVVSLVVIVDAAAHVLPLPGRRDPLSRAQGWTDLADAVTRARSSLPPACSATWIAADRYQDASELAFHLPAHPRVFSLNLGSRANQYDLWPQLATLAAPSDCVIYVVDTGERGASVVQKVHADHAMPIGNVDLHWDGAVVAQRSIWLLQGIPAAAVGTAFAPSTSVRAALDSLVAELPARAAVLDSVVTLFRHGPAPYLVAAADTGPAVSNSDRRAAIAKRIAALRPLLARAGAVSVHRDERYPECTFVRTGSRDSVAIGYILAAQGCALAQTPRDDRVWSVRGGPAATPAPGTVAASGDSGGRGTPRRAPETWLVYAAR